MSRNRRKEKSLSPIAQILCLTESCVSPMLCSEHRQKRVAVVQPLDRLTFPSLQPLSFQQAVCRGACLELLSRVNSSHQRRCARSGTRVHPTPSLICRLTPSDFVHLLSLALFFPSCFYLLPHKWPVSDLTGVSLFPQPQRWEIMQCVMIVLFLQASLKDR